MFKKKERKTKESGHYMLDLCCFSNSAGGGSESNAVSKALPGTNEEESEDVTVFSDAADDVNKKRQSRAAGIKQAGVTANDSIICR